MASRKMTVEGPQVKLVKVTVVDDHYLIKARFDYSIKMGTFIQTVRGSALTVRKGAFGTNIGVMPYSSVRVNKDGSKDYFAKSKVNDTLEFKLIQEVTTALKYAKQDGLAELKLDDLLEMYAEQENPELAKLKAEKRKAEAEQAEKLKEAGMQA